MAVKNNFAALPRLLNKAGDLLRKSGECVLLEKQLRYERAVVADISRLVVGLRESTQASCNGSWQEIAPDWQQLEAMTESCEREARIRELENPSSQEDFWANLVWMAERGTEDDLNLLQRLQQNPPYTSDEILRLLDMAIQRIRERTSARDDSPAAVQRQGEEAYQLHKAEWDRQYAGRYIAIYQGEVVASDAKKTRLMEKIVKKQRKEGPFRACVMKVGSPLLEVGGPGPDTDKRD